MTIRANIVVVDDHQMHRSMIGMNLQHAQKKLGDCQFTIIGECENGQELLDQIAGWQPDLITLDIRMPVMDGLTTLLHLRKAKGWRKPIVMVSSESSQTMDLHHSLHGADEVDHLSDAEKFGHMAKVEQRVLAGEVVPGKINSLLEGCEKLKLDPQQYALHLGANGFLHKPYQVDEVVAIVPEVLNGKTYQPI